MTGRERDGFPAQEDTVDALEQDVLAERDTGPPESTGAAETGDSGGEDSPAFELDLDPDEQGSADAGAANPD